MLVPVAFSKSRISFSATSRFFATYSFSVTPDQMSFMKKVVKLMMQVPGGEQSGIAWLRQIVACIGCSRKVPASSCSFTVSDSSLMK